MVIVALEGAMASLRFLGRKMARILGLAGEGDGRSRRLVAVIDCILNQNVRDAGAARFPAMDWDVVRLCRQYGVGILQMPCPEIAFLGLQRKRARGQSIREALDTDAGRRCCARIGAEVCDRIEEHVREGHRILAILGGNPASPGCAVHSGPMGLLAPSGVLMRELQAELRKRGIEVPFKGMRDHDSTLLAEDLEWLEGVLSEGVG